ncbi:MAG: class I SAM-dependent methyltransferase [Betaproteobacteria bacterium]
MSAWTERDSEEFRAIEDVAVPRRAEMLASIAAAAPFEPDEPFRFLDLGAGDGRLTALLLDCFGAAEAIALDGSASMRALAQARLGRFGNRARIAAFDLADLAWWDLMRGADLVVSSLAVHHLNEAKTQYLYKAAADRLPARGALIVGDLVAPAHAATARLAADAWDASARVQAESAGAPGRFQAFLDARWNLYRHPDPDDTPSALFHQLVWLRHAGFAAVDCVWLLAGHAVFGGYKQAAGAGGVPFDQALRSALAG